MSNPPEVCTVTPSPSLHEDENRQDAQKPQHEGRS